MYYDAECLSQWCTMSDECRPNSRRRSESHRHHRSAGRRSLDRPYICEVSISLVFTKIFARNAPVTAEGDVNDQLLRRKELADIARGGSVLSRRRAP